MRPFRFMSLPIMYASIEVYKFMGTVSSLVTNRLTFPDRALYIVTIHTLLEFRQSFRAKTSEFFP
jgi:hypothetical protein